MRPARVASPVVIVCAALALVPLAGCPGSGPSVSPPPAPAPAASGTAGSAGGFAWTMPAGWESRADTTGMHLASFVVAGSPETTGSISILGGGGGAVGPNVNRWRAQMGLPQLTPDAVAQLPTRRMLGVQAVVADLDGTFTPMDHGAAKPGWKLLGVVCPLQDRAATIFVKLVGPASVVNANRAAFDALCDSIHPQASASEGAAPQAAGQGLTAIRWTAPEGWMQAGARPMRIVTFVAGEKHDVECYITVLPHEAGGTAANLNRWRQQMGGTDLTPQGIAALPKVRVLGQDVPLVEAAGDFVDMMGTRHARNLLLGVCVYEKAKDRSVFVKMVGPEDEVRAERPRFEAFLGSLD